jgi:hypothetical protein
LSRWNLESIPWHQFDRAKVDATLLEQAKGAALVESNASDYVIYLHKVFAGDQEILQDIVDWGKEEELHGAALRKWCEMADPAFDYESALTRFKEAYHLPMVSASVRGSEAQELIARCVIETGTSTFYTALRDASAEPVFREICRRIAGDEVRHFQLFLKYLRERYAQQDLSLLKRLRTIFERVLEIEDAELTFAHFAANLGPHFDSGKKEQYTRRYLAKVAEIYKPRHFAMSVPMLAKASGLSLNMRLGRWIGCSIYWIFRLRYAAAAV